MVAKYERLLSQNAGVKMIDVDGEKVAYADLKAEWEYWKGEVAKEQGHNPVIATIRLDRLYR
jgi:hypothetical protein